MFSFILFYTNVIKNQDVRTSESQDDCARAMLFIYQRIHLISLNLLWWKIWVGWLFFFKKKRNNRDGELTLTKLISCCSWTHGSADRRRRVGVPGCAATRATTPCPGRTPARTSTRSNNSVASSRGWMKRRWTTGSRKCWWANLHAISLYYL